MTELSVDTKKRTVHLRVEPAGEDEPIDIHVKKYSLEQRPTGASLTLVDASTSRDWFTEVLREFVCGRPFIIPDRAATILKLLT